MVGNTGFRSFVRGTKGLEIKSRIHQTKLMLLFWSDYQRNLSTHILYI